jgi:pimeloyl-ACP methyl ester carboxylesterase
VDDWSQGIPLAYLRELSEYWARDYDMRRVATRLNALPQFHASIDELGVHFLHIRSAHAQARPLIMTHGWPGSVLEFLNVIGPLTDPLAHGGTAEDAFHLVVPALPGYGFSDKPTRAGTGVPRIAAAWHQLMGHLGYPEYYAQGGDLGAMVTVAMGNQRPEGLLGIHVNMALASPAALQTLGERQLKSRRCWQRSSGTGTTSPVTPPSKEPDRKPWATAWPTHRSANWPGSWRSSTPGPTATDTWRARCPARNCSTT